jgi:ATP-binding cassette, subfamily F, member 3
MPVTSRCPAIWNVAQELDATDQAAVEFVLDGDAALRSLERRIAAAEAADVDGTRLATLYADYAAAGGYDALSRAAQLLHGLGFSSLDENRAVREFSGGWRVRLNVARALMCRSDLLLLDEPTNHLDLDAILWLENWLRDYPGTLLLIAHDRDFLDRVVDRIVNIEHAKALVYRGNYTDFETARAAQLAQQSAMFTRQQREIAHMEAFVERFRAQATKARQAQSRLKALERMQRIAPAHVDSPFEFSFAEPPRLPRPLLALEESSAGYGDRVLLKQVDLTIYPGDRIGLLGRNGAGKSTLIKLMAREIDALSGARNDARDLSIGYFAQHQLEQLDASASPLLNLQRHGLIVGRRDTEQEQRNYLGSFGFVGDRVFERVGPFSGGEKARLALALVAYSKPNLLLLDEPTNHLDLEMRQALAMALQEYAGAVVMVSHDRHLLSSVIDRFYLVDSGAFTEFDGDLDDYARWLASSRSATESKVDADKDSPTKRASVPRPAPATKPLPKYVSSKALAGVRSRLARCEKRLQALSAETTLMDADLASPALYEVSERKRLEDLTAQRARLAQETDQVESEWLELSEQLESAGSTS